MLVGSPMVQEDTTSSLDASFGGVTHDNGYGTTTGVAGLSGESGTIKRTHCVQQAQVDLVQDIDVVPEQHGRALDVVGSIVLGVVGLSTYGAAAAHYSFEKDNYDSDLSFYQMDPSFFPKPTEPSAPTGAYVVAGGMMVGAAAWLIYSYTQLPKGEAPAPSRGQRHWTETRYVEATGCGLVPADRAAQAAN